MILFSGGHKNMITKKLGRVFAYLSSTLPRRTRFFYILILGLATQLVIELFLIGIWTFFNPYGISDLTLFFATGFPHAMAGNPLSVPAVLRASPSPTALSTPMTFSRPSPIPTLTPFSPQPHTTSQPTPSMVQVTTTFTIVMPLVASGKPITVPLENSITQATSVPALVPEEWIKWPEIPTVSERAKEIYRQGLAQGANSHVFSIIGDCQSMPDLFLGKYEGGRLPRGEEYLFLKDTVTNFAGSFGRQDVTTIDAANAAAILTSLWNTTKGCKSNESPLDCELRLYHPSIIFIAIGTHWTEKNGKYLRSIISTVIESGAVPIIATKGDNLEGNHHINLDLVRAATEYEMPLWNFWSTIQDLPKGGLDPMRQGGYMYLTDRGLERQSYSALLVLDSVWKQLRGY
jgi:hypothetical protein